MEKTRKHAKFRAEYLGPESCSGKGQAPGRAHTGRPGWARPPHLGWLHEEGQLRTTPHVTLGPSRPQTPSAPLAKDRPQHRGPKIPGVLTFQALALHKALGGLKVQIFTACWGMVQKRQEKQFLPLCSFLPSSNTCCVFLGPREKHGDTHHHGCLWSFWSWSNRTSASFLRGSVLPLSVAGWGFLG